MATQEKLQEKNIQELRELATKAEIEGRAGMSKDQLVAALADDSPKASPEKKGKAGEPTDNPPQFPLAGMTIKGQENQGKGETRLFQTEPDVKTWLTKAQAEEKGFFWKDEPKKA